MIRTPTGSITGLLAVVVEGCLGGTVLDCLVELRVGVLRGPQEARE